MKISIITATYNRQDTISECIASVNEQTYPDIEHIIVDGASSDNTIKKIKSIPNRVSQIISEPDDGIYSALNKGIENASGDIIGFLHADDTFSGTDIMQKIVSAFQKKDIDGIYGNLVFVKNKNVVRTWNSKPFKKSNLKFGWAPPHPTLFLKKEIYERSGLFNTSFKISGDYDFMLRIFNNSSFAFAYLPNIVTKMRIGGASTGDLSKTKIKWKEDLKALRNNNYPFAYIVLSLKKIRKFHQFIR